MYLLKASTAYKIYLSPPLKADKKPKISINKISRFVKCIISHFIVKNKYITNFKTTIVKGSVITVAILLIPLL